MSLTLWVGWRWGGGGSSPFLFVGLINCSAAIAFFLDRGRIVKREKRKKEKREKRKREKREKRENQTLGGARKIPEASGCYFWLYLLRGWGMLIR